MIAFFFFDFYFYYDSSEDIKILNDRLNAILANLEKHGYGIKESVRRFTRTSE